MQLLSLPIPRGVMLKQKKEVTGNLDYSVTKG
ncbi:hypothetical protein FHEFKHOI_01144 [Candidatus Methanoperedenaceae archaeon GB50]|nr:hypothetical protein AIOGIFDO_01136 [Candidatus Methanoperedenaceae archaeon GB37]CAD7772024.1 hypothetical protein FHEFKHOI_01144 [Candidatus Methanoperedenaceae archaeon GB50]CAD7776515.1 MAG: hypothetical protein KBONHNOK_00923 [Candidatus Methanoperedenaceae archaeon GB50]